MKKLLLILILFGFTSVVAFYFYSNKPHRNIQTEEARYKISATEFIKDFTSSQDSVFFKYLNKTVIVYGKLSQFSSNSLTIEENIFCTFTSTDYLPIIGEITYVKGRCIGYDDLLGEIKLDQCSIVNE